MFVNDSWGPLVNKDALFVVFRKARVRETTVDMVSEELLGGDQVEENEGKKEGQRW